MVWRSCSLIRVRSEPRHALSVSTLPPQQRTMGMSTVMRMATRALRLLRHGHGPVKAAAMPETMANLDGAVMVAGPARARRMEREGEWAWRAAHPRHIPPHIPSHPLFSPPHISLDAVRADRHLLHATSSRHSLMHPSYLQTPQNSSAPNSSVARISTLLSVR
jgi:hypothetical protein